MPRFFIRHERAPKGESKFKVYSPWWVDPYWFLTGSSIEKMVMAELDRRGIYFIYRAQTNELGGFVDPSWEADFLVPHHRIWIEVQGEYWHSLPGQIETDALRAASIEAAGWRPLFWWEGDIRTRLHELMDAVPEFYIANQEAELAARQANGYTTLANGIKLNFQVGSLSDQLVGLRKALSNRTQPPELRVRRKTSRRPK